MIGLANDFPLKVWSPVVRGRDIQSVQQLQQILDELPAVRQIADFVTLLRDAERHLQVLEMVRGRTGLSRGDLTRLGARVGVPRQTVTAWVKEGRPPRLYYYVERIASQDKAVMEEERVFQVAPKGIDSLEDLEQRLGEYYFAEVVRGTPGYGQRLELCTKYFEVLQLMGKGELKLAAARRVGIHHTMVGRWLRGQRPDLVKLAGCLPARVPKVGNRWLPTVMRGNFTPNRFIEAPMTPQHAGGVVEAVAGLEPLDNESIAAWRQAFGAASKVEAFGYILGVLVGQAERPQSGMTSVKVVLTLPRSAAWATRVGEATCYLLGRLGIAAGAERGAAAQAIQKTRVGWRSASSPVLAWMLSSCLGLRDQKTRRESPVHADWLLRAPLDLCRAFLQGVGDVAGATERSRIVLSLLCLSNRVLVQNLLERFDIRSTEMNQAVQIAERQSMARAAGLPLFRFAFEKQTQLQGLTQQQPDSEENR